MKCAACGSTDFCKEAGCTVCTKCGLVASDVDLATDGPTFAKEADGSSSVVGQFVPEDGIVRSRGRFGARSVGGGGAGSSGGGGGGGGQSREATLENARRIAAQIGGMLSLAPAIVESGNRYFALALNNKLVRGRRTSYVVAACLYIACRRERTPHMLVDFADAVQGNVYSLGGTFIRLCQAFMIQLPLVDPSLYIQRFAAQLGFGKKTLAVANTALRIVQRMGRDWIHTGRRPSGICGAGLILAARLHGFQRSSKEIIQVVRVCDTTLRRRLLEFADTKAASMTLEEFENDRVSPAPPQSVVQLAASAPADDGSNPPAFTRAREREETERRYLELWQRKQAGESVEALLEEERQRVGELRHKRAAKAKAELEAIEKMLKSSTAPAPAESSRAQATAAAAAEEDGEEEALRPSVGKKKEKSAKRKKTTKRKKKKKAEEEKEQVEEESSGSSSSSSTSTSSDSSSTSSSEEEEEEEEEPKRKKRGRKAKNRKAATTTECEDEGDEGEPMDVLEREIRETLHNTEFLHIERTAKRALERNARAFSSDSANPLSSSQAPTESPASSSTAAPTATPPPPPPPAPSASATAADNEDDENLEDIPDEDVDRYLHTAEQSALKGRVWEEMYKDVLEKLAAKQAAAEAAAAAGESEKGPKKRRASRGGTRESGATPRKRASARVNYDALSQLLSKDQSTLGVTTPGFASEPSTPAFPRLPVTAAPAAAAAASAAASQQRQESSDDSDDDDDDEEEEERRPLSLAQKLARKKQAEDEMDDTSFRESLGLSTGPTHADDYDEEDQAFFEDD